MSVVQKAGLRKICVGLFIFSVTSILLHTKDLPAPEYSQTSKYLIMALFAGNAFEHYVKGKSIDDKEEAK